jgi:hypothetical protein
VQQQQQQMKSEPEMSKKNRACVYKIRRYTFHSHLQLIVDLKKLKILRRYFDSKANGLILREFQSCCVYCKFFQNRDRHFVY